MCFKVAAAANDNSVRNCEEGDCSDIKKCNK